VNNPYEKTICNTENSWGGAPGFVESETASAESAIHFAEQLDHHSLHAPVAQ